MNKAPGILLLLAYLTTAFGSGAASAKKESSGIYRNNDFAKGVLSFAPPTGLNEEYGSEQNCRNDLEMH